MLIGLVGLAGAGKDEVRAVLENQGFEGMAFADPMRCMVSSLFIENNINTAFMKERQYKETIIPDLGVSYRQIMQVLGTEFGRNLSDDIWIRFIAAKIQGSCSEHFVVSDVRFMNEAQWIKNQGGMLWKIERPNLDAVREHASETEQRGIICDELIMNDSNLKMLRSKVEDKIYEIFERLDLHQPETVK